MIKALLMSLHTYMSNIKESKILDNKYISFWACTNLFLQGTKKILQDTKKNSRCKVC